MRRLIILSPDAGRGGVPGQVPVPNGGTPIQSQQGYPHAVPIGGLPPSSPRWGVPHPVPMGDTPMKSQHGVPPSIPPTCLGPEGNTVPLPSQDWMGYLPPPLETIMLGHVKPWSIRLLRFPRRRTFLSFFHFHWAGLHFPFLSCVKSTAVLNLLSCQYLNFNSQSRREIICNLSK